MHKVRDETSAVTHKSVESLYRATADHLPIGVREFLLYKNK